MELGVRQETMEVPGALPLQAAKPFATDSLHIFYPKKLIPFLFRPKWDSPNSLCVQGRGGSPPVKLLPPSAAGDVAGVPSSAHSKTTSPMFFFAKNATCFFPPPPNGQWGGGDLPEKPRCQERRPASFAKRHTGLFLPTVGKGNTKPPMQSLVGSLEWRLASSGTAGQEGGDRDDEQWCPGHEQEDWSMILFFLGVGFASVVGKKIAKDSPLVSKRGKRRCQFF